VQVAYPRGKTPPVRKLPVETRVAGVVDLVSVLACDPLASAGDADRETAIASAVHDARCRIGLVEGAVAGFAVTSPRSFFGRDFVDLLVVAVSQRRGGVGRSLLRAVLAAATSRTVWTSTNRSNAAMRALLADEDWEFSGELAGLDDGDPELFFFARVRSERP